MTGLVWLDFAVDDLENLYGCVAEDDPRAASRLVAQILESAQRLATMPKLGRIGRVAGTRELVVPRTPVIVAYRENGEAVEILRVLHGARLWPDEF